MMVDPDTGEQQEVHLEDVEQGLVNGLQRV
jgi:hypothetical protein